MFNTDIPIPEVAKYPFAKLQAGESVLFECASKDKANARKAAYRTANYHQWKCVVRSFKEGIRVWRLEQRLRVSAGIDAGNFNAKLPALKRTPRLGYSYLRVFMAIYYVDPEFS